MAPFWKRKKKLTKPVINWNKTDLRKIYRESIPEILGKNEVPSVGHGIDRIDDSLRNNMRPLTKEAYEEGVLHFFIPIIKVAGQILRMDVFKLIDEHKFKVEKHVRPCEFFLFELRDHEKFVKTVEQNNREALVDKSDLWANFILVEPAFSFGSQDLRESCKSMVSAVYEKSISYRIMTFSSTDKSISFFDATEELRRKQLLEALANRQVKKYVSTGMEAEKAHAQVKNDQKSLIEMMEKKRLVNRHLVKGTDILITMEPSLPGKSEYTMRWRHGDKIFSVSAVEEKVGVFLFGTLLFETYFSNRNFLRAD